MDSKWANGNTIRRDGGPFLSYVPYLTFSVFLCATTPGYAWWTLALPTGLRVLNATSRLVVALIIPRQRPILHRLRRESLPGKVFVQFAPRTRTSRLAHYRTVRLTRCLQPGTPFFALRRLTTLTFPLPVQCITLLTLKLVQGPAKLKPRTLF